MTSVITAALCQHLSTGWWCVWTMKSLIRTNLETCRSTAVIPAVLGREKWYMHNILDNCFFKMCSYPKHCSLKALGARHEKNNIIWIVDNCLPNTRLSLTLNYKLFLGIPSVLLPVALVNSCVWEEWMTCHCKQSKYFSSECACFWTEQGALQYLCQ